MAVKTGIDGVYFRVDTAHAIIHAKLKLNNKFYLLYGSRTQTQNIRERNAVAKKKFAHNYRQSHTNTLTMREKKTCKYSSERLISIWKFLINR